MSKSDWPRYLRAAMAAAGYERPADLARATGIGTAVLSRWLTAQTTPDLDNLRKLEPIVKIPLLDLMVAAGLLVPDEANWEQGPAPYPQVPEPVDRIVEEILASKRLSKRQKARLIALHRDHLDEVRQQAQATTREHLRLLEEITDDGTAV